MHVGGGLSLNFLPKQENADVRASNGSFQTKLQNVKKSLAGGASVPVAELKAVILQCCRMGFAFRGGDAWHRVDF